MAKMTQEQIRVRMRSLDNVFHRLIISLERLECFLEKMRLGENVNSNLLTTAIKTDRDLHDDKKNPPTKDTYYGEVQLDCSALYFQTSLDDKDVFDSAVKYFLSDLLEWYGGRNEEIPFDGVDAFVLPIIVTLSQQVKNVSEILEVVAKYVAIIPDMSSFSDEEKADAISKAIAVLISQMDAQHGKEHNEEISGQEVAFTEHKRGDSIDGYKRLVKAMLSLYDEAMPAIVIYRTVKNFLPQISAAVPTVTESSITEYIEKKNSATQCEINEQKDDMKEEPAIQHEENETSKEPAANSFEQKESQGDTNEDDIPFQEITTQS